MKNPLRPSFPLVGGIILGLGFGVAGVSLATEAGLGSSGVLSTPSCTVSGALTAITTVCAVPGGAGIASGQNIAALDADLSFEISNDTAPIAQGITSQIGAQKAIADADAKNRSQNTQVAIVANHAIDTTNSLVGQGAQPNLGCVNALGNEDALTASSYSRTTSDQVRRRLTSTANTSQSMAAVMQHNASMSPQQTDTTAMFGQIPTPDTSQTKAGPNGTTLTGYSAPDTVANTPQAVTDMTEFARALVDPDPVPALPAYMQAKIKNTPPGQLPPEVTNFLAQQNVWNARQSVARDAVGDVASYYLPSVPVDLWVQSMYSQMNPKGYLTTPYISRMALMDLMVKGKAENSSWYDTIASANESGLLRDIAQSEALANDLNFQRFRMEQQSLLMQSVEYAQRLQETQGKKYQDAYDAIMREDKSWAQ